MAIGYPVVRAQENLARTLRGIGDIGDTKYKAGLLDLESAKTAHALQLGELQKKSLERRGALEEIALRKAEDEEKMLNQPAKLGEVMDMMLQENPGPLDAKHVVGNVLADVAKATGWKRQGNRIVKGDDGSPVTYRDIKNHAELIQGIALAKTDADEWAEDTLAQYEANKGFHGDPIWEQRRKQAKAVQAQMKKDPTKVWDRKTNALVQLRGTFLDRGWSTKTIDTQLALIQNKKTNWLATQAETVKHGRALELEREKIKAKAREEGTVPGYVKEAYSMVRTLADEAGASDDLLAAIAGAEQDPEKAAEKMAMLKAFMGGKELDPATKKAYNKALAIIDAHQSQYVTEKKPDKTKTEPKAKITKAEAQKKYTELRRQGVTGPDAMAQLQGQFTWEK